MAIEIIPKKEKKTSPFFGSVIFYIGTILLIVSIISSLAFFFFEKGTSREIKEVDDMIEERKTDEARLLEDKIDEYNKKVRDFSRITQDRKSALPFFRAAAGVLHPEVFLTSFQVNVNERRISASAIAKDLTAFDQQSKALEKSQAISSFDISSFDRGERGVSFPISITFRETYLNTILREIREEIKR